MVMKNAFMYFFLRFVKKKKNTFKTVACECSDLEHNSILIVNVCMIFNPQFIHVLKRSRSLDCVGLYRADYDLDTMVAIISHLSGFKRPMGHIVHLSCSVTISKSRLSRLYLPFD